MMPPKPLISARIALYLLALLAGLIGPILVSLWAVNALQEDSREQAARDEMGHVATILASGMREPVWTLIPESGRPLLDAMLGNPDVLAITVQSMAQEQFLSGGKPPPDNDRELREVSRKIIHNGEMIGQVTVRFDLDNMIRPDTPDGRFVFLAAAMQVLISAGVIFLVMRLLSEQERTQALAERDADMLAHDQRFRDMANNVPGVVYQFVLDTQGNAQFAYVSPTVKRLVGLASTDIQRDASLWIDRIHPEDRAAFDNSIRQSFETLETWQFEGRMFHVDGSIIWFRGSSTPRRQDDGSVLWNGLLADISDLKRANKLLQDAHDNLEAVVARRTAELVTANEENQRARNRLQAIFDSATVGIVATDETGRLTTINTAFESMFGHDRETLLKMSITDITHPEDMEATTKQQGALFRGRQDLLNMEMRYLRKDGSAFWGQISAGPIKDGEGNIIGSIGTLIDISERRKFENALKESEKRFKDFTETASDWVWESDADHRITYISGTVFRNIPYDHEFFLGRSRLEFVPEADRLREAESWTQHLDDLNNQRSFHDFQYAMTREDGERRYLRVSGLPIFNGKGEFLGYRGTGTDVTDRIRSQQRLIDLSAAIDSMAQPVVVLDSQDRFLFTNKAFGNMDRDRTAPITLGVTTYENHLKALVKSNGFLPKDVDRDAWIAERLHRHRNPGDPFELHRQDGTWLMIDEQVLPSGGLVILFVDITETKRTHREMMVAKEEAEQANRAKSEFLSNMSHELRTPLNSILGFGQLMELDLDEDSEDSRREPIQYILRSGKHLLTLVDDILDLARIESGKLAISPEHVQPEDLASACARIAGTLAKPRNTELVVSDVFDGSLPPIHTDATRTRQILINLLSNAIKYAGDDARVELNASVIENRFLRFSVTDNGPGIAEEYHDQVFTPFARLGMETSEVEGTGIGLTISRALVLALGGNMGFESASGRGATFWFQLPLAGPAPAATALAEDSRDIGADNDYTKCPIHVLYVEDNTLNTRLMENILTRMTGISLDTAGTAEEGLDKARQSAPDVIFMDINLPGMSGFEAMAMIREDPALKSIPVVAFTADAMKDSVRRGSEAGFHAYVTKPIQIAEVSSVLRDIARIKTERQGTNRKQVDA